MDDIKVFNLIKSLDKTEIKNFKKFLDSPYFNRGRNLLKYFEFLLKYYPGFNLNKNQIMKKYLTGINENNSKLINTLNSELNKSLEDFFAVEFIFNNEYYYRFSLISKLNYNGLNKQIEKQYDIYKKKSIGMYEDQNLYYQLYMMDTMLLAALAMQGRYDRILELMISQSENISKLFIGLSNYFLNSFKVRDLEQVYPDKKLLLNLLIKNIDFDKVLVEFKNYNADKKTKLNLYILALLSEAKEKEKFIVPLIHTYKEIYPELNKGERTLFYTMINNFISGKTRDKFINEMFDLIKFVTSKKTLVTTGFKHFNIQNFKMSILISLRVKDIKWAKEFYISHLKYLNETEQEIAKGFALAFLYNADGEYEKSNEEILKIKSDNDFMNYDLRTLQLKNYYELSFKKPEYIENLIHGVNALNNYLITNKKVSVRIIESGKDFKKGIKLLLKYVKSDSKEREDMKFELTKMYSQIRNYWIKEKIEVLIN